MMHEKLGKVEEFNTGLTTAIEQYKFSVSTPFGFQQSVASPLGTQHFVPPQRLATFQSPSVSRLRDCDNSSIWLSGIRGGARSDVAQGGGARRADR